MSTDTGYCISCHSIVDLDAGRTLANHGRRLSATGFWSEFCPRSGLTASVVPETPEVDAAAFSDEYRPAKCPECDNPEAVATPDGQRAYMRSHVPPGGAEGDPLCPGSWGIPTYSIVEAL